MIQGAKEIDLWQKVSRELNFSDIYNPMRINSLISEISTAKINAVIWLHHHCVTLTQSYLDIADALEADSRFELWILVGIPIRNDGVLPIEEGFLKYRILYMPYIEDLRQLSWMNVILSSDFPHSRAPLFPQNCRRVNIPHGTDIKLEYSLDFYALGQSYDVIMATSLSSSLDVDLNRYRNVFQPSICDNQRGGFTRIAYGSPKLDRFCNAFIGKSPEDVIYNLSFWELESSETRQNLIETLQILLQIPMRGKLVVRPFPNQGELVWNELDDSIRKHPKFFFSTSPSYIEDYSFGAVLIFHRGSSAEMFNLASNRCTIQLAWGSRADIFQTEIGYLVEQCESLVQVVKYCLQNPFHRESEFQQRRANILPNFGQSLSVLLDNLAALVQGQNLPHWQQYVFENDPGTPEQQRENCARALVQNKLIMPMISKALADAEPQNPYYHFLAARALFFHIYPKRDDRRSWLVALEHLVKCLELSEHHPELIMGFSEWITEEMPHRFLALMGYASKIFSPTEQQMLMGLLNRLNLEPFAQSGLVSFWKECHSKQKNEHSELIKANFELKVNYTQELMNAGKHQQAQSLLTELRSTLS